ncbi:protein trichome birefringence-like 6 [Triticum urartu]|uniref:Trichome birefringence-like N-terminal domain-containing protein n=1 Tax=Triticum urartu TaxID=4572 RepID=A0A8R7UA10_TRIUA|nr:protein trichome birefringence-like 6 [Triticum urartu]XP_048571349.1 protein trichome birefringence-like 6 [Triticum urartu]
MERQRGGSSPSRPASPKSLLLISFASSSLLFSFLFSLFALRFGRPIHLPFAASIGANGSATAVPPVRGGGGGAGAEVFIGGGGGALGEDSAVEGDRHGRAGGLPVGSAMKADEAGPGGGIFETPAGDAVSEMPEVAEAGGYSLRGLDSTVEEKGGVRPGGDSEKLAKDSVPVKPNSTEGKKADAVSARRSNVGNASASHGHGAAASVEKSDRAKPAQAVNFSTEASGSVPVAGTKGESLHGGHAGEKGDSSAQGSYASQQAGQWEISNRSAKNNSGEAPANPNTKQDANVIQEAVQRKLDLARSSIAQCDVYDGSWVFDESYPLYASNSCPFVDQGFSCEANGRTEQKYTKWRWQPRHCNIPRFDARKMLEMLRGKRLVFAGDSLNRNQWESMMCLLREAVSDPARIHETRGRKITKERGDYNFKFLDYNCTVEYHVTHFLVHEGKSRIGQKHARTLRIDTIDRSSSRWKGANVLVFNTAHWWSHHKTKAGLNYYQEGDTVHPHLDASTAFHRALTTWASWVDRYIDPRKTQVFFRSSSPSHFSGGEWNSGGHCRESTMPLNDTRARPVPERNAMLEQVAKQMKTPVTVLNITNLSGLRIDGHPSVYGSKAGDLTASSTQDCSHWCLPGVPDTWNELLFYHLVSSHENGFTS